MSQPTSCFRHPFEVAEDPTLEPQAKRAILASWVSDRAAIEGYPALRKPCGGFDPISVDDIFAALRMLDADQTSSMAVR